MIEFKTRQIRMKAQRGRINPAAFITAREREERILGWIRYRGGSVPHSQLLMCIWRLADAEQLERVMSKLIRRGKIELKVEHFGNKPRKTYLVV